MILFGMMSRQRHMYSGLGMGELRLKLAKSMPIKMAPGVLMVELMRILAVVRLVLGVALLPG